jgi:hypothetical protein
MEVIKGVELDTPFFVPKFIFYTKRRNLLNINLIHFFNIYYSYKNIKVWHKKTGGQNAHPLNKRTRLKD